MSDHIQQAIRMLELQVEGLDERRGELVKAIDALRPLAESKKKISKTAAKRNERTNERTNERAKRAPRRTARRSLPDDGETIIAALRVKSPQSPADLAKVLKLARPTLTRQIKALLKSGAVVATGGGPRNRQFSLPGRRAKEAP